MNPVLSALGVVSAAGVGKAAFEGALRRGQSCLSMGQVPNFSSEPVALGVCDALEIIPGEDRALTLARVAMAECVEGVGSLSCPPERLGLVVGTTCGGTLSLEAALEDGPIPGGGDPAHIPFDAVTRSLSKVFNIQGPTRTLTVACASGTQVFEVARGLLRSGVVDGVFVGGVDTVSGFILKGFKSLRGLGGLPYTIFRPESDTGGGVVLGEGAAFFYMEPRAAALGGGRPVLGTLLGSFGCNEGYALTRPRSDGSGIAECLRRALGDAGLEPKAVAHVSLHGTGTRAGDQAEYAGVSDVFGDGLMTLGFSAIKPIFGHTSGAAGSLEVASLLIAEGEGFELGLSEADTMTVPIPREAGAPGSIGLAASLGAGFGGSNAALILGCGPRKWDQETRAGLGRRTLGARGDGPWITAVGSAIPGEGELGAPPLGEWRGGAWLRGLGEVTLSRESQRLDPLAALFVLAGHRCLEGQGLDRLNLGLSLGSAFGCLESSEAFLKGRRPNPIIFQNTVCNASLAYLSMILGISGPSLMVTQGPRAGIAALQEGRRLLAEGQCDGVLVIGGDRGLSPELGVALGGNARGLREGSIALLLEHPERARARGARPLGVLQGFDQAAMGEVTPAEAVLLAMPQGLVKVALSRLDTYQRIGAGIGAVASPCQATSKGLSLTLQWTA